MSVHHALKAYLRVEVTSHAFLNINFMLWLLLPLGKTPYFHMIRARWVLEPV
jgi:hypothetical protein